MSRDGITGLVVLATSLFLFWITLGLERHPLVPVGPEFYPQLVLGTTALLALLLVITDVIAYRRARAPVSVSTVRANYMLVAIAFAIFMIYVIALPYLGFRVATFAFLITLPLALEPPRGVRRRWMLVLTVAVIATLVIHFVFENYLQVLLPRGRWTGF